MNDTEKTYLQIDKISHPAPTIRVIIYHLICLLSTELIRNKGDPTNAIINVSPALCCSSDLCPVPCCRFWRREIPRLPSRCARCRKVRSNPSRTPPIFVESNQDVDSGLPSWLGKSASGVGEGAAVIGDRKLNGRFGNICFFSLLPSTTLKMWLVTYNNGPYGAVNLFCAIHS